MVRRPFPSLLPAVLVACGGAQQPAPVAMPSATIAIATPMPAPPPVTLRTTTEGISAAMVTRDGRVLFATSDAIIERPASGDTARRVPFTHAPASETTKDAPYATVVFPRQGDTFFVERENEKSERVSELWDAKTLTPRLDLKLTLGEVSGFSEDGTTFLLMACTPSLAPATMKGEARDHYCEASVRNAADGAVLSTFAAPPADPRNGPFMPYLSPDGRYVLFVGGQELQVYNVQTRARVLTRKGGRIYPNAVPEEDGAEVFALLSPDTLLLSRFGVLEVDDLKTGRVLETQRYSTAIDDGYRHKLSPDRKTVATFSQRENSVRLWDLRKTVRTAKLPAGIDCDSCTLTFQPNGGVRVYEAQKDDKTFTLDIAPEGIITAQIESSEKGAFYTFDRGGFHVERTQDATTSRLPNGKPGPDLTQFSSFSVSQGVLLVSGQNAMGAIRSDGTITWLGSAAHDTPHPILTRFGLALHTHRDALVSIGGPKAAFEAAPKDGSLIAQSATHAFYQLNAPWRLLARTTQGSQSAESLLTEGVMLAPGGGEASMGKHALADGPHLLGVLHSGGRGLLACTVGESACKELPDARSALGLQWPMALVSTGFRKPSFKGKVPLAKGAIRHVLTLNNLETGEGAPVTEEEGSYTFGLIRGPELLLLSFATDNDHVLQARTLDGKVVWKLPIEGHGTGKGRLLSNIPYVASPTELLVQNAYDRARGFLRINLATRAYSHVQVFEGAAIETSSDAAPKVWGDLTSLDGIVWCETPGAGSSTTLTLASRCLAAPAPRSK